MKTIRNLSLVVVALIALVACNKVTYRKTPGGMPYKLYKGNSSKKIFTGNIVKYHVTYLVNDSVYLTTFGKLPAYEGVNEQPVPYNISEIWLKLQPGDSIVATQMMDTLMKRDPRLATDKRFKKGDRVIIRLKLLDVFQGDSAVAADEKVEREKFMNGESRFIEKYLAEKNIKTVKTKSGAYLEIINPGEGNMIDSGRFVSVNYTGRTFSGKVFDSNTDTAFHHTQPISFTTGTPGMIKGFDEAIRMMKPGSTARAYIPSMLAYGGNPDPQSGIKPFEHLIFDLAVLSVSDKAPPPPAHRSQIKIDPAQPNK